MVTNVLTDFFKDDFIEGDFNQNSFMIEVHQNFVTVDRKHQHTSLIESKTIIVDKDVIVYLHEKKEDVFDLECKWLWRNPTIFENLSQKQAHDLQKIIIQISHAQRLVAIQNEELSGIRVGKQVWSSKNIDLDMGIDSKIPSGEDPTGEGRGRLYSYKGVESIENLFTDWRVPTVKDYLELFGFFDLRCWEELTERMEFNLCGFFSHRIPEKEFNMFLEMNRALKPGKGGFYWTSNIESFDYKNKLSGKRNYVYFNKYNQQTTIEESVNSNDNMFSLRLIKK